MKKLAGAELRDKLAELLRIKFSNVVLEKRLLATSADVYYVDDTNPIFPRKIAIEAKDYNKSLTSEDISKIYNLYSPSLINREIDSLWVISNHVLASSPRNTLDKLPGVVYSTLGEFQSSLMNFRNLISDNILEFENHESSKNFIHSRVNESSQTVFDYTQKWLSGSSIGLIIYGGYGVGKTSYSHFVSSHYSKLHMSGDFERIPLRFALGGLYTKQDLPSLISSTLSGAGGRSSVKDFSYPLFLQMVKLGKFLIILDGFDEMRHAMDIDDFVFTFEQMKPLFEGNSKVIILGRPDSFFSVEEENRIINSLFESVSKSAGNIEKLEVSLFNNDEIDSYLNQYFKNNIDNIDKSLVEKFKAVRSHYEKSEMDVLSRPVQLHMFTKVMDDFVYNGMDLNRYNLYSKFIYGFVAREVRKSSRTLKVPERNILGIDDARSAFMENLAWWLLVSKKENRFFAHEVPRAIIPAGLRGGSSDSATLREALLGSVVEHVRSGVLSTKGNMAYFFPHKSYLEYLVSAFFCHADFTIEMYREFNRASNGEILSFISEGPRLGIRNLRRGLGYILGTVESKMIEICSTDDVINEEIRDLRKFNVTEQNIYLYYYSLVRRGLNEDATEFLRKCYLEVGTLSRISAVLSCASHAINETQDRGFVLFILANSITSMNKIHIRDYLLRSQPLSFSRSDSSTVKSITVAECVKFDSRKSLIEISSGDLARLARRASANALYVQLETKSDSFKRVSVPTKDLTDLLDEDWRDIVLGVAAKARETDDRIPYLLLGEASVRFSSSPSS